MLGRQEASEQMAEILGISNEEILDIADSGEVKNEDLIAYIKTLRPKYKLAMLSNVGSRERIEQRFNAGELDGLFDVVVASGDVGMIKPEREIYELTAEKLGVLPEECVMIDDVREFCDGAEVAGMTAIQFTSTKQAISDLTALIDTQKEKY
jgi:putative hydrolase of the HAD superfamily